MGRDKEIIGRLIGIETKLDTIISFFLAIEALEESPEESPEEDPPECQHPKEARIDMRTMGWEERWECGECGYKHAMRKIETKEEIKP